MKDLCNTQRCLSVWRRRHRHHLHSLTAGPLCPHHEHHVPVHILVSSFHLHWICSLLWCFGCRLPCKNRVTTCLENLEMSGNYTDVREMWGISLIYVMEMSGNCQGKSLVMENCPNSNGFAPGYQHDLEYLPWSRKMWVCLVSCSWCVAAYFSFSLTSVTGVCADLRSSVHTLSWCTVVQAADFCAHVGPACRRNSDGGGRHDIEVLWGPADCWWSRPVWFAASSHRSLPLSDRSLGQEPARFCQHLGNFLFGFLFDHGVLKCDFCFRPKC